MIIRLKDKIERHAEEKIDCRKRKNVINDRLIEEEKI